MLKWTDELLVEVNSHSQIVNSSVFVRLLLAMVTTGELCCIFFILFRIHVIIFSMFQVINIH